MRHLFIKKIKNIWLKSGVHLHWILEVDVLFICPSGKEEPDVSISKYNSEGYVAMSQNFMSQTNRLWMEIYQIVKENCATEYNGATPQDDVMERLLLARKGN